MDYKTPGVYIEEISKFPPSVAAVETAIPVFIGFTEKAIAPNGEVLTRVPTRIKSLLDYTTLFGGPPMQTMTAQVDSNNKVISVELTPDPATVTAENPAHFKMYYALSAFFNNGGGPCYIISVGNYSANNGSGNSSANYSLMGNGTGTSPGGLAQAKKIDEITLLVFPDAAMLSPGNYYNLMSDALKQCASLQDRFTLIDVKSNGSLATDPPLGLRDSTTLGTANLSYGAAYYPNVQTIFNYTYDDDSMLLNGGAFSNVSLATAKGNATMKAHLTSEFMTKLAAEANKNYVDLPPSPFIAGVYASVDSTRGVWKAPANVSISAGRKLKKVIDDYDQESLNVHVTGKSINAIRKFTGRGNIVWGARTLAGNDNEWRYVPVRRFFIMAEESIKNATSQFVFEPNDANTWIKVRAMIENFLLNQWRDGALAGAKPEQAFFVKVGLGETMTAQDILEGKMIVEIGMAVVRPAEFIILRFSHKMQEA